MLVAPARRSLLIVEVAQWGHGARSATGVDLGTVFVVGDIADLVQAVFDMPVSAHPSGQLGCGGLVGGQTGHGVGDLGGPLVGSRPSGLAGDLDGLAGMREQDPAAHGDNLDAALGAPAVSAAALDVKRRGY